MQTLVQVESGMLAGEDGPVRIFRGIPFAAPPVGDLRWRPPAPPKTWTGIRDATTFGNICSQFGGNNAPIGSEDCLTLNIYAANPPASGKQPVIVFIHGGAGIAGTCDES